MIEAVYVFGTLTSIACAALLLRSFRQSRARLLLWSCLCFMGLAANNVELLVDLYVVPNVDLAIVRSATALGAFVLMLFGLLWDSR